MKINKKKIACFALAGALVIPGAIGLAGCEKGHTHAFNSDPFYEVVTEGGTKVARSWRECSCGAEDAHKKVDNAVIVTPNSEDENYIQSVQDGNINGKTIVLDEGEYNEEINIRPTKVTSSVYTVENAEKGTAVDGELDAETTYFYSRNIQNVTFASVEGAVIKNTIQAFSCNMYKNYPITISWDYVKDMDANLMSSVVYYSEINFNNIKFTSMNFEGAEGRILLYTYYGDIENAYIDNCTFETDSPHLNDEDSNRGASVCIKSKDVTAVTIKNINVNKNKSSGHFQGVYIANADTVSVTNNDISNTTHNGIAVTSNSSNGYTTGKITIENNKVSEATQQSIKVNGPKNAKITISHNEIINTVKNSADWPWVIQLGNFKAVKNNDLTYTDCSDYTISDNTFNGNKMAELSDTNSYASNIYIFIPGVEPEISYPEE